VNEHYLFPYRGHITSRRLTKKIISVHDNGVQTFKKDLQTENTQITPLENCTFIYRVLLYTICVLVKIMLAIITNTANYKGSNSVKKQM